MGQAGSLPVWVNLIWMSISGITLVGAIIWTLFIFWPILRETKRMQIRALQLMEESNTNLKDVIDKMDPLIAQADRIMEQIERKMEDPRLEKILDRADKTLTPLPVKRRSEEEE